MSEEETSDSEMALLGSKQPPQKSAHDQQITDRHLRSQLGIIDTQLKALGLYEEGLSYEQKEELLAVVAASRETAEKEESMRIRAKEWQQQVFVDDDEAELGAKTAKLSLKSSPPTLADACTSTITSEPAHQMVTVEQHHEPNPSQDLFETSKSEIIPMKCSPETSEMPQTPDTSSTSVQQEEKNRRSLGRRGRGRRACVEYRTVQATVSRSTSQAFELMETEPDEMAKMDSCRQKKELEKLMPEWHPCASPQALTMDCDRFLCKDQISPPCNDPSTHTEMLLHSFEEFHTAVDQFQRKSGVYVPWGQPVTVGRPYATRSTRARGPDPESNDGIYSFQSPNPNDATTNSEESMCGAYLRMRQLLEKRSSPSTQNSTPPSKTCKDTPQSLRKSLAQVSLGPKIGSCLRRTTHLSNTLSVRSANANLSDRETHKENLITNKTPIAQRNLVPASSTVGAKQNVRVAFSNRQVDKSCGERKTGAQLSQNSVGLIRTNTRNSCPSRLLVNQQTSRVTRSTRRLETKEVGNKKPLLQKFDEKSKQPRGQENLPDQTKRKAFSSNVKALSSPLKRMKGAGTV